MESIKVEGLKNPPEVFTDKDGQMVLVTGHRRVTSVRLLADDGVEGFTPDMVIDVSELVGSTDQDLLVWSVADNENRLNLTPLERVAVSRKFLTGGIPDERAAIALGVSVKTYRRDLIPISGRILLKAAACRASTRHAVFIFRPSRRRSER
jgi:ParB-like chromosome segregation protein Spo0J